MYSPTLLPANSAARRLRVPMRWLISEARQGRVPALNAGGKFMFDIEAVEIVLLERARTGDGARSDRQDLEPMSGRTPAAER